MFASIYAKIAGIVVALALLGLGIWLFYARIIKNPATTYQKASQIQNFNYHYDYHPFLGFGCMRIPVKEEPKK
jgi:hypothetical protein